MKACKAQSVFSIILACIIGLPAYAQWEHGGKTIGWGSPSNYIAMAIVGDGAAIGVWNSAINQYLDLNAQYVDSAGYVLWGEYGVRVSENNDGGQSQPAILHDGEGGAFIIWTDTRHYPDQGKAIYGQRIDRYGNLLWDRNGVRLTADSMTNEFAGIYDDGHGGFVTVYRSRWSWITIMIGAQRVDGNGNVLWDSTGIKLTTPINDPYEPKTCKVSDSAFMTCWVETKDSPIFDSDIYIQSFDLNGNVLWNPEGIPAVQYPYGQGNLEDGHYIVPDGNNGAVVVWVDFRHLANGNRILYADRFSSTGQSLWQLNGRKLGDENAYYGATECWAYKIGSNFMFHWHGGRYSAFRVSYLDLNGNFIWPEPVVLDTFSVSIVTMDPPGVLKYLASYYDGTHHVTGSKMDTTGFQYWPHRPETWGRGNALRVISDCLGGMIVYWKSSNNNYIMTSKVYEDGHVGGDTTTAIYENKEIYLPESIRLFQNYPNPFNSYTTISYQLYRQTDIMMEVFDILGRRILEKQFPSQMEGRHNYSLYINDKPSGIYFVRLGTAEGLSKKIRIILLK